MKSQVLRGVKWSAVENFGVRIVTLGGFLVLARLLDEEAFGLVALGLAYVALLELIVRIGFSEVIVQKEKLTELHKDTAFWASVALGLVALALTWLLAPIAATWSDNPKLEQVLLWLSIGIIPLSLTQVQHGVLMREMEFRSLAIRRLLGAVAGTAAGIACAFAGFGYWSLIVQQLTMRVIEFLALYWVTRWFPQLRFSVVCLKDMSSFSAKILGINSVGFAGAQADRFIIGHFLGVSALGVYVVGRKVVEVILNAIIMVIGRVAFSAFSRLQSDERRLRRAAISVAQLTTIVGTPFLVFIAIKGDVLNVLLFGEKWADAGPIVQIGAAAAVARVLSMFAGPLYKARGMPGMVFIATASRAVASIVLCTALAPYGLIPMAAGWMAGEVVGAAVLLGRLRVTAVLRLGALLRGYLKIGLIVAMASASMIGVGGYVSGFIGMMWLFLIEFSVFLVAYGLLLRLVWPNAFADTLDALFGIMTGKPGTIPAAK